MNPFKHKQLEEFTIEDCELYISRYPYGEHLIEVKSRLRNLKKQQQERPKENKKTVETKKPDKQIGEVKKTNLAVNTIFACIGVLMIGAIIIIIISDVDWWTKVPIMGGMTLLAKFLAWLKKELNP